MQWCKKLATAALSGALAMSPIAAPPVVAAARVNASAAAAASALDVAKTQGTATVLDDEEMSNVNLFRDSTPSVVYITNLGLKQDYYSLNAEQVPQGAGSGFVWDDRGHIVTNFHVVKGASDLRVNFQGDQRVYSAKVLGFDEDKDVAVLRVDEIDAARLRPIPLGKSSSLQVGQKVFAIGNPFGLDHTLTTGIISGLGRELSSGNTGRPILGVIQTDAAINPGNSGGPLLDSGGRLIGINTAILSPSGASSGVGFALPVDAVTGIVNQIIQFGKVTRPVLGLTLAPDSAVKQLMGPKVQGVLVLGVAEGGPAAKAGMKGTYRDYDGNLVLGDLIVGINGDAIKDSADLYRKLDGFKVGDEVPVRVFRGGSGEVTVTVTLGAKVTRFSAA